MTTSTYLAHSQINTRHITSFSNQATIWGILVQLRTDFNIPGTNFFYNAVFHQKWNKYDVVSLPCPLKGFSVINSHVNISRGGQVFSCSRANNGFRYEGWIFILGGCFNLKTMNYGSVRIGKQGNNNSKFLFTSLR